MNGIDIQKRIVANMKIIEEEASKGTFTLSEKASAALRDNIYLRGICPHCFDETGHCIFCDKEAD